MMESPTERQRQLGRQQHSSGSEERRVHWREIRLIQKHDHHS